MNLYWSSSVDRVEPDVLINVAAITISILSLIVSALLALRQTRTAAAGYALPVILEIFDQFRSEEFFEARRYVYHRLNQEFDRPVAYTDLPAEALAKVRAVAGRYDDLGKLVAHGIVDEKLIVGANGTAVRRVWESVAPFVHEERRKHGVATWSYLEDLACRVRERPPREVYRELGLRRYADA
jgi:hypothetical protein